MPLRLVPGAEVRFWTRRGSRRHLNGGHSQSPFSKTHRTFRLGHYPDPGGAAPYACRPPTVRPRPPGRRLRRAPKAFSGKGRCFLLTHIQDDRFAGLCSSETPFISARRQQGAGTPLVMQPSPNPPKNHPRTAAGTTPNRRQKPSKKNNPLVFLKKTRYVMGGRAGGGWVPRIFKNLGKNAKTKSRTRKANHRQNQTGTPKAAHPEPKLPQPETDNDATCKAITPSPWVYGTVFLIFGLASGVYIPDDRRRGRRLPATQSARKRPETELGASSATELGPDKYNRMGSASSFILIRIGNGASHPTGHRAPGAEIVGDGKRQAFLAHLPSTDAGVCQALTG